MFSSRSLLPQPTDNSRYDHAYNCFVRAQDFAKANNLVRALDQYNAAIDIFQRLKKQLDYKHPLYYKVIKSLINCYLGKTQYYKQQGLTRSALEQNLLASETFNHIGFEPTDNDYRTYAKLAFDSVHLYTELNDNKGAIEFILDGIAVLKKIPKKKRKDCDHRLIAHYYNAIGKLYFNHGLMKNACHYFNKAEVSLMRMTNPTTKDIHSLKQSFGKIASFYQSKNLAKHSKKYEAKYVKYQNLLLAREKVQMRFFAETPDRLNAPAIILDGTHHCDQTIKSHK